MNSQLFFILNLVVGGLFLVWFLSARKGGGRGPTQLRLKDQAQREPRGTPSASTTSTTPVKADSDKRTPALEPVEPEKRTEKSLNVLFLYNGHDWDAYAVLGVPAGASLPLVTEKYQELLRNADEGQTEFYGAAYKAILKKT
ncbi:MAG: hypothetical protein KF789_10265 [Bdellovibrionaceae bacterium]|nr:hypothetical protein [Pseudobdellovibrionaceae bacterium]